MRERERERDAAAKSFNFRSWQDGTWAGGGRERVFGGMVLTMQIENGRRKREGRREEAEVDL